MTGRGTHGGDPADATPGGRERALRATDEAVTERIERFLAGRGARGESFTSAELADAVGVTRFGERDAHLFLVALMGQGRVHRDPLGGWRTPGTGAA